MTELVLGGDVSTQFTYGKPEDFADAIAKAKAEQEALCGYKLIVTKVRQADMLDSNGARIVEVFATFSPYPAVTEAQLAADPSLLPPVVPVPPPVDMSKQAPLTAGADGTIAKRT